MGYNHYRHVRRISATLWQMEPIGPSGNDLWLKANTSDNYPIIKIEGNTYIQLCVKTDLLIKQITTQMAKITYSANVTTIAGGNITGDDLVLKANSIDANALTIRGGTTKIKFGEYTIGAAADSTGYILIDDKDGNERKVMIQA